MVPASLRERYRRVYSRDAASPELGKLIQAATSFVGAQLQPIQSQKNLSRLLGRSMAAFNRKRNSDDEVREMKGYYKYSTTRCEVVLRRQVELPDNI